MKVKYTKIKKPTMPSKMVRCNICNKIQSNEDIKLGCSRCEWQSQGKDVITPYWIDYHKSKGHKEIAPCQYEIKKSMTNGHKKNGKFHPHKKSNSGLSSDQLD